MARVPKTSGSSVATAQDVGLGQAQAEASNTMTQQVRPNPEAFGAGRGRAAQQAGQGLEAFSSFVNEAHVRVRNREDTISRTKAYTTFFEDANNEFNRFQTEADVTDPKAIAKFDADLTKKFETVLSGHGGSEDSKARLQVQLETTRAQIKSQATEFALGQQRKMVADALGERIAGISAQVVADPTQMQASFAQLDAQIDDMAPALTPEEENQFRDVGRQQIIISSVEGLIGRADYAGARDAITDNPFIAESLTNEQQRSLVTRINEGLTRHVKAREEATLKIEGIEAAIGRKLTGPERMKAFGLAPAAGEKTPAMKIAETEEALGRPLTEPERLKIVGVEAAQAQSTKGKEIADRTLFVDQFGEGSDQVKALDDSMGTDPVKLTEVGGIRKEFTKLSTPFVEVRDAYNRIAASANDPSPAGDLALIFNYMKVLDPGSVVRESEFATAESSSAWLQQNEEAGTTIPRPVASAIRKMATGQRLAPEQRADFIDRAADLFVAQSKSQVALEESFRGIAERNKMKPDDVVVDFIGDLRNFKRPGLATDQDGKPTLQIGLDGKPIEPPSVGGSGAQPTQDKPVTEQPTQEQSAVTYDKMELSDLIKVDVDSLSRLDKKKVDKRLKELGF